MQDEIKAPPTIEWNTYSGPANGKQHTNGHAMADSDKAEFARLSELKPIDYDRERKDAAKKLRIKVGTLDAEVIRLRPKAADTGGSDFLPETELWPHPVDGAELLDDLAATVARHVGLPPGGETAVALWSVHAHALDAAYVSPILAITSPTPACGKSTLLALIGKLTPRSLFASNITAAAVFRSIEKWTPTLLCDEADTYMKTNDELRGIIDSGHSRDLAFVVRTVGDDHEPQKFSTWGPKAIALIGALHATLASRSVHVPMRRLKQDEPPKEPFRFDRAHHLPPLASQAARWATDNIDKLKAADPDMPEGMRNRQADNWRGLLAIADLAGGDWPERARAAAIMLDQPDAGETFPTMLLSDLRDLFTEGHQSHISSADIVAHLICMDDRPWAELKGGKPISKNTLARMLKGFKIMPKGIRDGASTPKGYTVGDCKDAFDRYLPTATATPQQ